MKQKLLTIKTLLVAAMLGVGVSAWADVPTYTWDFTNTTTWTTAKVSTGNAVTYDNNGVASGADGYTGYGVTFKFTENMVKFGNVNTAKNTTTSGLWWEKNTAAYGSLENNYVSIVIPVGFKVTVTPFATSSRTLKYTLNGGTNTTEHKSNEAITYTNDTENPVTLVAYAKNPDAAYYNIGIISIVLEDYSAVASHDWSVKAVIKNTSTEIDAWDGGTLNEGEEYFVWGKKVIKYNNQYYELDDDKFSGNNMYFNTTMGTADAVHEISYTLNENIVAFEEVGTGTDKYSAGGYAWNSNKYVETSLDKGLYQLDIFVVSNGSGGSNHRHENLYVNNEVVYTTDNTDGLLSQRFFVSADETAVYVRGAGSSNNGDNIDYVIIRKDTEVSGAIADCKVYETSSDFATYINAKYDAGVLLTAAQVYAAHTAWQISQGIVTAGVRDITKVIRNAAVNDAAATDWAGAGTFDACPEYTGRPTGDTYVLDKFSGDMWATQVVYGLPAGTYTVTAATRGAVGSYSHIYINQEPYQAPDFATVATDALGDGETAGTLGYGFSRKTATFTITETKNILLGFYVQSITNMWASCDDWHMYKIESIPVEVTSAGMATYVPAYDLDFTDTDIKAYTAKVNSKETCTLTEIKKVPAGTPVLLIGSTDDIPVAASTDAVGDNDLVAGTATTAADGVATTDGDYTNMILNVVDEKVGFYFANGKTVAANRAYLHFASSYAPSAGAPMMLVFADDVVTGINTVNGSAVKANGSEGVYNLSGQRVAKPTRGLYIVGGKKVVVK